MVYLSVLYVPLAELLRKCTTRGYVRCYATML